MAACTKGLGMVLALAVLAGCGGERQASGTDVSVSGVGPAETVPTGSTVNFTMTVRNQGKNAAADLQIINQISAGLSQSSITCEAVGATCPATIGPVMTLPSLPVGGQLVFKVSATVNVVSSGVVTNSLSVTLPDDVNRLDNSAVVQAAVSATASNLVVTGTGPAGNVAGGGSAEFVMVVRNDGPDAASLLKITDTVGGNLTLTSLTCAATGGGVCPTPGVVMNVDTLPAGAALEFRVTTAVQPGISGAIINTLSVSAENDRNREDNSFTATGNAFTAKAGVYATGVGPAGTVSGGTTANFTMTVNNAGPDAATDLKFVNTVGSNLTLTGVTCTASGGATCPTSLGPVMNTPTMPAGGVLTFGVSAYVALGTNGSFTNTLSVTPSNDPDRTDNTAVAVGTAATSRASLQVTGTAPADQVAGGGTANFVMTVTNTGPDAAQDLRLVNTVGSNLTLTGVTCTASGGAACPTTGAVMNVPTLPVGGLLTFGVQARVASGANGAITNQMVASATNATAQQSNSAVAVGQAFTAVSNLTLTGTAPAAVPAGTSGRFTMVLSNQGPEAATDVQVVNTVGGNLTLTAVGCTASGGATCPTGGVVMAVPSLPVGGALTFAVDATVAGATNGSIINSMTATATGGQRTQVTGIAVGTAYAHNIAVAATPPTGPLAGGSSANFSMVVTNSGPGTATDVAITNTLGTGLSLNGAITCTASLGAVCPATTGASMTAPSVPTNGVLTFNVPVTVNAGANGSATNAMSVSSPGDVRVTDNNATGAVSVFSADLGVSISGPGTVVAGNTAAFTAIVSNPGPGAASNVAIQIAASGGTVASVTCTPTANCPTTLGTSMSLASVPAGRTMTFVINVPVTSSPSTVGASISVTGDGDLSTANNSASATTQGVNALNGSYKVYAADGNEYTLSMNFDTLRYTMATTGGAGSETAFTYDSATGNYIVNGNERFRLAEDLVVGNHRFGSTVLPFVAARRFATSIAEAAGAFNVASRTVPSDGTAAFSRPATLRVTGNVLQLCETSVLATPVQNCDVAGLSSYTLAVSGDLFTGTHTLTGEKFIFRVAKTGAAEVLLQAQAVSSGGQRLRIGLPDAASLAGGVLQGGTAGGDWITMTLGAQSWAFTGTLGSDNASLQRLTNGGPFSMLSGVRTSDGATVYVLQSSPLAVTVGAFGGAASGLLQVALP